MSSTPRSEFVEMTAHDEIGQPDPRVVTRYRAADGRSMQRESGLTPQGNPIDERWVLRAADGTFIDVDQYRSDLAERHGLRLQSS